jgi:hypothetical protein
MVTSLIFFWGAHAANYLGQHWFQVKRHFFCIQNIATQKDVDIVED